MARANASTRAALQRGGFDGGLEKFRRKLAAFETELIPEVGRLMHESITVGSRLTNAPGQPQDDGDLLKSWTLKVTKHSAESVSNSPYARQNEDGLRRGGKPYVQRSAKGGRHSVRLTRRGMQRIVNEAAIKVAERKRGAA